MQALSLLVADEDKGFKKKKAWFFRFKKRMGTLYDMSVSAHKPVGNKFLSMGDDAVVQMVENYWKNLCGARHSYNLHDPDSMILGDEMGFPYESLPKYIYDIVGAAANPWVKSYGKEKNEFTVLFFFTGAGRKLGVWFIFKGEFGKTLDKSSGGWCEELLPDGYTAFFFFRDKAWMNSSLYARCLWQMRKMWEDGRAAGLWQSNTNTHNFIMI